MKTEAKSAPAGRTWPLALLVVRVYVDSPGGESSRVEGYMFLCPNRNEPPYPLTWVLSPFRGTYTGTDCYSLLHNYTVMKASPRTC